MSHCIDPNPISPPTEANGAILNIQAALTSGDDEPSNEELVSALSMPIYAVPKPGSSKFRLVTDHSAGQFALNNMISRKDIAGVTLDNVQDLGNALRYLRQQEPDLDLILWKADISEAYRRMPMHPLWQIKQIVSFHLKRYVDHCNVFGGHASQRIWHAFMSLVIWIAVMKYLSQLLYIYVDDSFSVQKRGGERLFYKRYHKYLPSNLIRLLQLWDFIGLPHEERKHVLGDVLPIIGFEVDPNLMRVRMSDKSILAMLFFGFFGLLRLGELVQPDTSSLRSTSKISWRHDVHLDSTFFSFSIPQSKTDVGFEGNQVVIQKSTTAPDPFALFHKYRVSRDSHFALFPQLWLHSDGSVPSRSWFLSRLHSVFPRSIGGHSMRAGGATSLAAAGVPPSQIQAIGRWRTDTFERYIRHHPTLLQAVLFHGRSIHDPPFANVS